MVTIVTTLAVLVTALVAVSGQDVCDSIPNDCTLISRTTCNRACGKGQMREELQCEGESAPRIRDRDCCLGPCPPGGGGHPVKLCRDCWPKCDLTNFGADRAAILANIEQVIQDISELTEVEQLMAKPFLENRIDEQRQSITALLAKIADMEKSEDDMSLESREQMETIKAAVSDMEAVLSMMEDDLDALVVPP